LASGIVHPEVQEGSRCHEGCGQQEDGLDGRRRSGNRARHRIHAAHHHALRAARRDEQGPPGQPDGGLADKARPVADDRVADLRRLHDVGLLCLAALLPRPAGTRRRVGRGCHRRAHRPVDDRRQRPRGLPHPLLRPAHHVARRRVGRARGRRRRRGPGRLLRVGGGALPRGHGSDRRRHSGAAGVSTRGRPVGRAGHGRVFRLAPGQRRWDRRVARARLPCAPAVRGDRRRNRRPHDAAGPSATTRAPGPAPTGRRHRRA
jgi:hypothetical protein